VDALRWFVLLTAAAGVIAWICWGRANRRYAWFAIPPVLWLVHVAVFHIARLLGLSISPVALNQWSLAIHLHALILLVGIPLILWRGKITYE